MGNELVFIRFFQTVIGANPVADICTMDLDGSNVQRITINPPGKEWDCYAPSWSPDGSKILFSSYSHRPSVNWADIHVMDADGSNRVRLTDGPWENEGASWSPDGTRIVYASARADGKTDISVMSADGSNKQRLTSSPTYDFAPAWSANGIVFLRNVTDGVNELVLVAPDGSNERQLTNLGKLISDPAWSPDATRIAFSARILNPDMGLAEIYSIDARSGTDLIRHTQGGAGHESVCYSPDGTRLALSSNRLGSSYNIFITELGSTTWKQLTFGIEDDFDIDWK